MKKYFRKIINFIKEHKKIFIVLAALIVIAFIIYFIFFRINIKTVKSVKKVLSPNFYDVHCLDSSCDYIIASKGDKFGKYTTYVYDSNGKKIAKISDKYDSSNSYTKEVSSAAKNYVIFSKRDYTTSKTIGYVLSNTKGKAKYNSDNYLYALTDNLVAEKIDDTCKIINKDGKVIFENVENISTYANNSILSINVKGESIILDSKGNSILNGYRIVYEVTDKKNNTLYFVVEDANKNSYYYYNYNKNKVGEDSFNGYVKGDNEGELIVNINKSGSYKKYILNKDGKLTEYNKEVSNDFIMSIKKEIDTDKYSVYSNSIKIENQKLVLVNDKKSNSLGIYDLGSKKYTKLLGYTKENGLSTVSVIESEDDELYLQINCSSNYCKKSTMIVYDMIKNRELYRNENKDNIAQSYTGYEGDYKVIKYSINSSDEYKGKYVLYDKNNKELLKSEYQIVVVDKKPLFGKFTSNKSLILFSSKQNKALNNEDNLASKMLISTTCVYKYSDKDKTYLLNENGKLLKSAKGSVSLIYSNDAIVYLEDKKVNIVNPIDNKSKYYKLKKNEKINDNSGQSIVPYKNTVYINNTVDNYAKVINANGRTVKKIKNSSINNVIYNRKSDKVIIITKNIKNNNNLYGLYIAK